MTNILLLFFALPVAIIILSIIFETLINSPIKIAGITFSILLIVTFAFLDEMFLIFTILYTILSYIVAWLTKQWITNNQNEEHCLENMIENVNAETIQNLRDLVNSNVTQIPRNNCSCRRR